MTVPLAVKLTTPDGEERMITRELADLRFSSKMRGGFATCEAPVSRRANLPAIPEMSRLTVSDTRNGRTVWEGRVLTPGRSVSSRGQQADLSAIGEGIAATKDYDGPYMIVDSNLSSWDQQQSARKEMNVSVTTVPGSLAGETGLVFKASGNVVNGDTTFAWFRDLWLARQPIGALYFYWQSGESDRAIDLRIGDQPLSVSSVFASYPWNTVGGGALFTFTPGTYPQSMAPKFAWRFTSTGLVQDSTWSAITQAVVTARLLGKDRQPLPNATYQSTPWITIDRVFTDVLARFCPTLDIENAALTAGTFPFTQLSWPSGITPTQVLDEVLDMEPDMTWAVWERQPNGRYRTELTTMPTEVRYEATAADGWSSPAPSSSAYDRVAVLWKNAAGLEEVTWVTANSPMLTARGVSRTATINLGNEVGTEAQATQRGQAFLADHTVPPTGGRLTVARRIWDRMEGRWAEPWEIRPGYLVRIRGVHSNPDALNATSPDGVTVARIVETSFSVSDAAAELDLDAPVLTEKRLLARMANARTRG